MESNSCNTQEILQNHYSYLLEQQYLAEEENVLDFLYPAEEDEDDDEDLDESFDEDDEDEDIDEEEEEEYQLKGN